ncbi:MAG: PAS domain-containing protein, partial [Pseudomonadota bacterium]
MTTPAPHMPSGLDESSILNAMPQIVLIVDREGAIHEANAAAEVFFGVSRSHLKRTLLHDLVAFGSPLLALCDQVFRTEKSINEYNIDLGLPRVHADRPIDVYGALLTEKPE